MNELIISERITIAEQEVSYSASRASGPGGQHVNKVSTKVTLHFNVLHSATLSDEQRLRILRKLKTRISARGILQISSQANRSQFANKEAVKKRFIELIQEALRRKPPRKKTQVPRAVKQKRLDHKKQHARLKEMRKKKDDF